MGQLDFGKIISAAAVSTLGVLSLIVVALGVLAFYFFKGSPEKVKLTVWWTALVAGGMFALAFIRQADQADAGGGGPGPASTQTPASSTPETPIPEVSETPVPATSRTPTRTVPHGETPQAKAAEFDPANLTGRWHDTDGYLYDVIHSGNVVMYQQYLNGANVGSAQGTLEGSTLRYGFIGKQDGSEGECNATVAGDHRSISGSCASGGRRWQFFVER